MSDQNRRQFFLAFGAAALTGQALAQQIHQAVASAYTPQFFTPQEFATLRVLVDLMIPADGNSKGAIDAGAAEFIDFVCSKVENVAGYYRYNMNWMDQEMLRRTGKLFIDAPVTEQTKLLDTLAYRKNATPQNSTVVDFFAYFRGMVVDAYYTSPVGMADIGYMGNQVLDSFSVPDEAVQYALSRSPFH